jgi:hypothetical protein
MPRCPVVSYEEGARAHPFLWFLWLLCTYGSYAPCRANSSTATRGRVRGAGCSPRGRPSPPAAPAAAGAGAGVNVPPLLITPPLQSPACDA